MHTRIWPNHPAAAVVGHQDGGGNHQPILRPQRRRVPRTDAAATAHVTRRVGVVATGVVNAALGAGPAGAGWAVTLDWVVSNCPGIDGDEMVRRPTWPFTRKDPMNLVYATKDILKSRRTRYS
uniref:Uncharacterized protein n=1 Tax=Triticum urartu TaxID=4572 RepID=A0A8R7Q377_TRIUA